MTEQEHFFKQRVHDFFERLPKMSSAEILMIDENADFETVKRNYHMLAREFHPDKAFASDDTQMKHKMSVIFDAITKAYTLLKDDTRRKDFFHSLGKAPKHDHDDDHTVRVNEQFQRGIKELKNGNYWGAVEIFRFVVRRMPKNARAWSYLSLTLTKVPNRLKEAEETILEARKLEPFDAEHVASLGNIYLMAGLKKRAETQFKKALQLDSRNETAQKGLEQLKK